MNYLISDYRDLEKKYRDFYTQQELSQYCEQAQYNIKLVFYELVTNVLKHSKCRAKVYLEKQDSNYVKIFVESECCMKIESLLIPRTNMECGRGFYIVSSICEQTEFLQDGKIIMCVICTNELKIRIDEVKKLIGNATLIAATKNVDVETLKKAWEYGITIFGENRVQELLDKYEYFHGVEWHFIGHLQTNKVKYIIDKVSLIHSVDSIKLANEIHIQAKKHDKMQDVLLQVNIAKEQSKSGFFAEDIILAYEKIKSFTNVNVIGLMTMLPNVKKIENNIGFYLQTKALYDIMNKENTFKHLSMGMSSDYFLAVKNGSNMIRVGSAIFGERK